MHLDPTVEDVKKLCSTCRKAAKVCVWGGWRTQNIPQLLLEQLVAEDRCLAVCARKRVIVTLRSWFKHFKWFKRPEPGPCHFRRLTPQLMPSFFAAE